MEVHMRKYALFSSLGLLMLNVFFCSDSNNIDLSGVDQNFTVSSDNTLSIEADDPTVDDGISVGETFEGPTPTVPDTVDTSDSDDDDGDGILDSDDHLPDDCTDMVVTSNGVSSAHIVLNDEELFSPDDFHNVDFHETMNVNLKDGDNTITIKLAGSPGDQLNVRFYNCSKDPVELLFETTVTRTTGAPNMN